MRVSVLLLFSALGSLVAQQPAPDSQPKQFGKVSGRIFCQDTGVPARFAGVTLLAEQPSKTPLIDPASLGKDADFGKVMAKALTSLMKESSLSTVTGLDGTFSLDKVPPGTYYLIPQYAGYLSPLSGYSQKERMQASDAMVTAVESTSQKIVVEADHLASVTVELTRGGTLSGKVTYDDGSPAPGIIPTLLKREKDGKWNDLGAASVLPVATDDHGQFHFYGLPAGEYAVKAALPTTQALLGMGAAGISMHMATGDALVVFNGGALREKDIKAIEIKSEEQRNDVEVVFPLSGLHAISGSVVAKVDNHAVNSGSITLQDPDSKTPLRTAMVGQNGTFLLNYVPEGTYLLKVDGAADTQPRNGDSSGGELSRLLNSKVVKGFGPAEMPVIVKGDVDGLVVQVPDAVAKAKVADKE